MFDEDDFGYEDAYRKGKEEDYSRRRIPIYDRERHRDRYDKDEYDTRERREPPFSSQRRQQQYPRDYEQRMYQEHSMGHPQGMPNQENINRGQQQYQQHQQPGYENRDKPINNPTNDILNSTVEDILQNKLGLNIGGKNTNSRNSNPRNNEKIISPNTNSNKQPEILDENEGQEKKGLSKFEKIAGVATLLVAGKYIVDAFSKKNKGENGEGGDSGDTHSNKPARTGTITNIFGILMATIIGGITIFLGFLVLGNTTTQFEGTKFEEDYYNLTSRVIKPFQYEDGTTPTPEPTLDVIEDFKKRSLELKIAPFKKLNDTTILVKISDSEFIKSKRESIKNAGYVRVVIARTSDNSIDSIIVGDTLAGKCTDLQLLPTKGATNNGEAFICGKSTIIKNSEVFNKEAYLSLINTAATETKGFWNKFFKGSNKDKEDTKPLQKDITKEETSQHKTQTTTEDGELSDEERLQLELELQQRAEKEKYENSFGQYVPNTEIVEDTVNAVTDKARDIKDSIGQKVGEN